MTDHRTLSTKNEYHLPKETFLTVIHFCKQYPYWIDELKALTDTSKAVSYDNDLIIASADSDPTSTLAMKRAELSRKKELVDDTAKATAGDLWEWLVLGVCYDRPYHYLLHRGIPCGKDLYYKMRRKFYFEIAKKV